MKRLLWNMTGMIILKSLENKITDYIIPNNNI